MNKHKRKQNFSFLSTSASGVRESSGAGGEWVPKVDGRYSGYNISQVKLWH